MLSQDAIVGRAMPVPVAGSIRRIAPARYDVRDAVGWKTREAIFHAGRANTACARARSDDRYLQAVRVALRITNFGVAPTCSTLPNSRLSLW